MPEFPLGGGGGLRWAHGLTSFNHSLYRSLVFIFNLTTWKKHWRILGDGTVKLLCNMSHFRTHFKKSRVNTCPVSLLPSRGFYIPRLVFYLVAFIFGDSSWRVCVCVYALSHLSVPLFTSSRLLTPPPCGVPAFSFHVFCCILLPLRVLFSLLVFLPSFLLVFPCHFAFSLFFLWSRVSVFHSFCSLLLFIHLVLLLSSSLSCFSLCRGCLLCNYPASSSCP